MMFSSGDGHDGEINWHNSGEEATYWDTYKFAGDYEWRFYVGNGSGAPIHRYPIEVRQTRYTFELPQNHEDIIPDVVVPGMTITFPRPTQFLDLQGRNLLDEANEPLLQLLFPAASGRTQLLNAVWANTTLRVNGPTGSVPMVGGGTNLLGTRQFLINDIGRGYRAVYDFNNRAAVDADDALSVVTSYTTSTFMCDAGPNLDFNIINGRDDFFEGVPPVNLGKSRQVRFAPMPEVAFLPTFSQFKLGRPVELPRPMVHLSKETDDSNPMFNRVDFSDTDRSFANFTKVTVTFRGTGTNATARDILENGTLRAAGDTTSKNLEITELVRNERGDYTFRFIPQFENGTYEFKYHTRTLFGTGFLSTSNPRTETSGTGNPWDSTLFFTYYPLDTITVTANMVAPEIKWTVPYTHITAENRAHYEALNPEINYEINDAVVTAEGAERFGSMYGVKEGQILQRRVDQEDISGEVYFDRAPELNNLLPGSFTSSNTQISSSVGAEERGKLVLPALLASHNTEALELNYTIWLKRYDGGILQESIMFLWENGAPVTASDDGKRQPFDPRIGLTLNFAVEERYVCDCVGDCAGAPSGVEYWNTGLMRAFLHEDRNSRFDLTVWASTKGSIRDEGTNVWRVGVPSVQLNYTFNVVQDGNYRMETMADNTTIIRPTIASLQLSQTAFYEGDTISFNRLLPKCPTTDDSDIEMRYWLFIEDAGVLEEITDIDETRVQLKLHRGEPLADKIFEALEASLQITIVAVAMNYFALVPNFLDTRDFFDVDFSNFIKDINRDIADVPAGIAIRLEDVMIYDLDYAEAAQILDRTGAEWNDTTWNAWFNTANNNTRRDRNARVYLPSFSFKYENAERDVMVDGMIPNPAYPGDGTVPAEIPGKVPGKVAGPMPEEGYTSSITVSVRAPRTTAQPPAMGGANPFRAEMIDGTARVLIGEDGTSHSVSNPHKDKIHFVSGSLGEHTVVIKVGNNGGHVSVLVGRVRVEGEPTATPYFPDGAITQARVGGTVPLPRVHLTLDLVEFVASTGTAMTIVSRDGLVVGTYGISGRIEGVGHIETSTMRFTPEIRGRYVFEYVINIGVNATHLANLQTIMPEARAVRDIRIGHVVEVEDMTQADLRLEFKDSSVYDGIVGPNRGLNRADNNPRPFGMSETKPDALPDPGPEGDFVGSAEEWEAAMTAFLDREEEIKAWEDHAARLVTIEHFNLLPDFFDGVTEFQMSMQQLGRAMEKVRETGAGASARDVFRFGRIYLPNPDFGMMAGIIAPNDFHDVVVRNVRVSNPRREGEFLLNTATGVGVNNYVMVDGVRYRFFRPIGEMTVVPGVAPQNRFTDDRTRRFAPEEFCDGTYIIEYELDYNGIIKPLRFEVGIGDTATPTLRFMGDWRDTLFGRTYKVGDRFGGAGGFNTRDVFMVDPGQGGRTLFSDWYIARYLQVEIETPDGREVLPGITEENLVVTPSLTTAGNQQLDNNRGNDPLNFQGNRNYSFNFAMSGEYVITFRIRSESNMPTNLRMTVYIETDSDRKISPTTVWGTVLIVLSSGILLGVVIYFWQTGKVTKSFTTRVANKFKRKKKDDGAEGSESSQEVIIEAPAEGL
jgi:hypothetical protein